MTLQNKIYQQRITEALGAGGNAGIGQQEPNFFQQAPKPTRPNWEFPSPRGPANQTRGLYSGGGLSGIDGLPVTEEWQNQWDKWINSGAASGAPMPWPPQFQGMFENNDAFDFHPDNPHSGNMYWNSVFNWLFGETGGDNASWGNGALQQMIDAGYTDLGQYGGNIDWDIVQDLLGGSNLYSAWFVMLMFGDPNNPQYAILENWFNQMLSQNPTYHHLLMIWTYLGQQLPDLFNPQNI